MSKNILVLSWNLENLFHPQSGGPRNDMTPKEGWTLERYTQKIKRVAHIIKKILLEYGNRNIPAIIGLNEVENSKVAQDILAHLPQRFEMVKDPKFKLEYNDNIIIYDKNFLTLKKANYLQFFDRFDKGEILEAIFTCKLKNNQVELITYCCHLKARPANKYYTQMYRQSVCDQLQTRIWKLHNGDKFNKRIKAYPEESHPESLTLDKNIIVMGDFNDDPFSISIMDYLMATYDQHTVKHQQDLSKVILYNTSWEWLNRKFPGSCFYSKCLTSKWSMLDQIIISPSLISGGQPLKYKAKSFKVIQNLTCDSQGLPKSACFYDQDDQLVWQEGYSDHFPVIIKLDHVN